MRSRIFLRRKNKVILKEYKQKLSKALLATILKNLESLGYTLSEEVINRLSTYPKDKAELFYKSTLKTLKTLVGKKAYRPMYPNFPTQVMEASDAELYLNAIMHYLGDWVGLRIIPDYRKKKRPPLLDRVDLKVIELGTKEECYGILTGLLGSNGSLSETDKEDVTWFVENTPVLKDYIPENIPYKENLVLLASLLLKSGEGTQDIAQCFKTATDVLRLAAAMSDGDISLAEKCPFKKFRRPERRMFLELLESCGNITEDMIRYKKRWLRLGEILHPSSYAAKYPRCAKSFDIIRNKKYQTFNGKVEEALLNRKMLVAAELLETRPGEFARRLDFILRSTTKRPQIIESFSKVVDKVSTPVVFQVMKHFKHRNDEKDIRVVMPKGNMGKIQALDVISKAINTETCKKVESVCRKSLVKRFKELPSLGNTYLEKDLENYIVPFSQRSASKALHTLVRGTKLPLSSDKDTIRFFTWWKDGEERTDIDLSALMYDADWDYKQHISFTNLRELGCYHSGDITSAPQGASEFVDISISKTLERGIRYLVPSLYSYTNQAYCDLPECFAGWMMRESLDSGEIYDPRTVEQKMDLTANTKVCLPVIFDLVERIAYWADISLTKAPSDGGFYNTVESSENTMSLLGKSIVNLTKTNLKELFELHIKARGKVVKTMDEAETIFSVKKGITPFDTEKILSDFL